MTLMQRSSALYEADGDWAYGAWRGMDLAPPAAAEPQFDRGCVNCHTERASGRDMVFNRVGQLPEMLLAMPASGVAR